MRKRIPFTICQTANLGGSEAIVPAMPGYRIEVESLFVSVPKLTAGGPYTDQITIYGFEDPATRLSSAIPSIYTVVFNEQRTATAPSNFYVPLRGRTPRSFGLNVFATDGSGGTDITAPYLTISGVYVKD